MRSDWRLPLCTGKERIKVNGEKAHPTQKPEALLERVILASTNSGDLILDPFFGTGTTGAVAKRLGRHFLGIEIDPGYISIAQHRIDVLQVDPGMSKLAETEHSERGKRIPFARLLQLGLVKEGQALYFGESSNQRAFIQADGNLQFGDVSGSIHKIGRFLTKAPCNGWLAWYYINQETGNREPIDRLRMKVRNDLYPNENNLSVNREEL